MIICAIFEEWYLGDGIYPLLRVNKKVSLSFCISITDQTSSGEKHGYLNKIKDAEYSFCGEVIEIYGKKNRRLIIVDTGNFRFYIEGGIFVPIGKFIAGQGKLLVDYFRWVENLDSYKNPPDIFYNFIINNIRKVKIPEEFIGRNRDGNIRSTLTSLSVNEYTGSDVTEIDDMENNYEMTSFFLLDLKEIDESIERTFIS